MPRVVGFTADAAVYCSDCAEKRYGPDAPARLDREGNRVHAVFSDSEWDSPQHCGACGRFLPVRLSAVGHNYVREQGQQGVPAEWRRFYPEAFDQRRTGRR